MPVDSKWHAVEPELRLDKQRKPSHAYGQHIAH